MAAINMPLNTIVPPMNLMKSQSITASSPKLQDEVQHCIEGTDDSDCA
jgi:hypothetical protein